MEVMFMPIELPVPPFTTANAFVHSLAAWVRNTASEQASIEVEVQK
jgi:hypothetical protein